MKKVVFISLALIVFALSACSGSNYARKCDGRKAKSTRMGNM
jgi:hypothetical protein